MRAQLRLTSLPLHLLRLTSRLTDTTRFRVVFSLSFSSFPLLTTINRIVSQVKFSNDRLKFTTWVIVTYVACYRMTQHETRFSYVVALCRRSRNIWIRAKIQEVTFEVTYRGVLSELCRISIRFVDLRTSSNSFFCQTDRTWAIIDATIGNCSRRIDAIRESNHLEDTWLFEIRVMIIELIIGECMFTVHRRRFKFDKCLNLRVISSEVESRLCLELNRSDVTLFVKNIVVWPFLIPFV